MAFELNHLPLVQQPDLLGQYRRQSSIDSRCMRRIIDGKDEYIELQNKVWSTLGNDPLFREFSHMNELELPLSEQRLIAWKKLVCIVQYGFLTKEEEQQDPVKVAVLDNALWAVHIPASVKFALHFTMFGRTITAMGSERHAKFMFPGGLNSKVHSLEIFGCFCLTELSHGSNALGVRTTAIYNHSRKTIVLNTPDIEAAKWWAGNLGKTATHALVFAKLIVRGKDEGLHAMIVPIRCPKTRIRYNGVLAGDIGRKAGQNGLDNGFLAFQNYEIPKENLLNRFGDISESGEYISPFKDKKQRFGMMLGALSGGRVGITSGTLVHMRLALTIAIRYSATRLQFKSTGADFELPIWEYPSQRYRLLPRLSELFAISVFSRWLLTEHAENKKMMSNKIPSTQSLKTIAEIHAISSASKPYASWVSRDAIQECREACGGHGYASINRLGMLRDDNDPNVTYEGENKVLIQQTSRFLLKCVQAVEANMPGENLKKLQEISPLGSVLFLANYLTILQSSFRGNSSQELRRIHVLLEAFEWRVVFLLKETAEKFQIEVTRSKNEFDAWNNSQVFHCQPLGLAFIEALILRKNIEFLESRAIEHEQTAEVFRRLLVLFALYRINLDMGVFRQRDFISASQSKLIQDEILQLLCELKTETIAIVDAIAAPDSILQAPIGLSNGQPYINYWNHLISNEDTVARPHFHSLLSQQVFPASRL